VLTAAPLAGKVRKELSQAREILAHRLYLLELKRKTNPIVAGFVETRRFSLCRVATLQQCT
jgi:hypothetical protein